MFSRIDHVSIAVRDYEKARHFFEEVLGAVPCLGGMDDNLNFYWRVFAMGDLTRFELISPSAEKSFLDGFLSDKDGGVHHITIETPDVRKARDWLEENDVPYFGFSEIGDVWKELFIHPKDAFGVLIQIAEFKPEDWLVEKNGAGCDLTVAHPGGGKVNLSLNKNEIKQLIRELEEVA